MALDLLLTHGYRLFEDPHELAVMKPYPPLGILYLSSHLKAQGFGVEVFNSTFADLHAFERRLDVSQPPVVGIYTNLMTRVNVLDLVARCRARGAFVVLGGPDPANHADRYLAAGADAIVIGEGEVTLSELLTALRGPSPTDLSEIAGLAFRAADGRVVRTQPRANLADLDSQPFPDREAIDLDRYVATWREHHGRGSVSLITARGCPYTCTWCSHAVYGYTHRRRSPENVADEVERIIERYRPEMLWYADDVFTIHRTWLTRYADELERRGIRIPFETISREDRLDEGIVDTLARMGAFRIWVGAESGSQRVLDAMQRRTDAARVPDVVHQLQRAGIEAGMFIMLGFDGEEVADLDETVALLKRASPDAFLTTVAYPIEGTPYASQVADRILPLVPWELGSDRDRTVAGRHSRRFYRHATRWMVNDVAFHRERIARQPEPPTTGQDVAQRQDRTDGDAPDHGRGGAWESGAGMTVRPGTAPFDAAASAYDATFTDTQLGRRLREAAWAWTDRAFGPGDRVLEIGCGTGADAAHLADRGVVVVATDSSERMLDLARARMIVRDTNDLVRVRHLDAATIGADGWAAGLDAPFEGVLSDFGALNCVRDRVRLLRGLADVVRPGGRVVLVAMGPMCPWEVAWHVAHREPSAAVRRWRAGARASVGSGATVRVWYPSPARVAQEATPWFSVTGVGGLGVALPPSGLAAMAERRGWLLRAAAPWERRLTRTRLGAALADHWVLELRRRA